MNVGSGSEISIKELAEKIAKIIGYDGNIVWDSKMPDGTPRKILDINKIKSLGWEPKTKLEDGLKIAIRDYRDNFYLKYADYGYISKDNEWKATTNPVKKCNTGLPIATGLLMFLLLMIYLLVEKNYFI